MNISEQRRCLTIARDEGLITAEQYEKTITEIEGLPVDSDAGLLLSRSGVLNEDQARHVMGLLFESGSEHGRGPELEPNDEPAFPEFTILEEIAPGRGGMGQVFKAREINLDRIVALKTAKRALQTQEGRDFFIREARAAAKLDHPNIVKIFSFNLQHTTPYYVMQFVDGVPIDQACMGRGTPHTVRLLEKTARALAYAHSQGIIHHDVKPDNVIVDHADEPQITDFGLAGRWEDMGVSEAAQKAPLAGTPPFMTPEVLQGGGVATPAVDVYSFGVMMYKLLTGEYPYKGRTFAELRQSVLQDEPALPQDINPDIPEPLQRICLKAMERDPLQRYESAEHLADDLRRFQEGRTVFVRPTRYQLELAGKLRNHMTEVQLWCKQRLIMMTEMDRLLRPYRRLLERDSHWYELSRRFPWETMLLRLGGWMVLISSLLWAFYWEDLDRTEHIAAVGLPTLALNIAGWFFWRRRNHLNAKIFLSTGALLLPVLVGVVLTEYEWLRFPQAAAYELFGELDSASLPTNAQLIVVFTAFLAYCILLFRQLPSNVFIAWTSVGAYLLFAAIWLRCGLLQFMEDEQIALPILSAVSLPLTSYALARGLARSRYARWAGGFYAYFPAPFAVLLTFLAIFGSYEWLDAELAADSQIIGGWCMLNGALYSVIALLSSKSRSSFVRLWGHFFTLLIPASFLIPANLLYDKGPALFRIGETAVTFYQLAAIVFAVSFVLTGIRLSRETLALPGLLGLAVTLGRLTYTHFLDYRSWPLALVLAGSLAMAVGLTLTLLRRERPP